MSSENIVILGNVPIEYPLDKLTEKHTVIACGNTYKSANFAYAVVNIETRLQDMLNSASFRETDVLTTQSLFKKYIFFDQVDYLPSFPGEKIAGTAEECSEQALALMLACWLEKKNVYLFGYDIQDLDERSKLLNLGSIYPHNNIIYVRKPNPTKIFLFDNYENMSVMDYKEFKQLQ